MRNNVVGLEAAAVDRADGNDGAFDRIHLTSDDVLQSADDLSGYRDGINTQMRATTVRTLTLQGDKDGVTGGL